MTESNLTLAINNYSGILQPKGPNDLTAAFTALQVKQELLRHGRVQVALVDKTLSMVNDDGQVRPVVKKLQELGVPVFSFGDGQVGERVLEVGVTEFSGGAGNGAETPFAAITSALMFLGRPVAGLDTKEAVVKALHGNPDYDGYYKGVGNCYVRGEGLVRASPTFVSVPLSEKVDDAFGEIERNMKTPDFDAIKTLVEMGLPIDIMVITDELGGLKLTPDFIQIIKPLIEKAGGDFDEFVAQHEKTLFNNYFPPLDRLASEFRSKKVAVTFLAPESNLSGDYGERGLKYLFTYWQAMATLLGGDAIKLETGANYRIDALIKALNLATEQVNIITDTVTKFLPPSVS